MGVVFFVDRDEEEESSPTGDETGSRRGLLSWL
jgi:hypothetical protein